VPISAQGIAAAILAADPTMAGTSWASVALGIGTGVSVWAVSPAVSLEGVVVGTVGGGVVTGKFFLNPSPLPLSATIAAAGFLGLDAGRLALAVGLGVSNSLNLSAGYTGTSVGAIGGDTSKVVLADPVSLTSLITAALAAQGILGPLAPQLAAGLGSGLAAMVATGGGVGVAVGTPGPSPGSGTSRSSLF